MRVIVNFSITAVSKASLDSTIKIGQIFREIMDKARARSLSVVEYEIPTIYTPKTDELCLVKDIVLMKWDCECRWRDLDNFIEAWDAVENEMKENSKTIGPHFTML